MLLSYTASLRMFFTLNFLSFYCVSFVPYFLHSFHFIFLLFSFHLCSDHLQCSAHTFSTFDLIYFRFVTRMFVLLHIPWSTERNKNARTENNRQSRTLFSTKFICHVSLQTERCDYYLHHIRFLSVCLWVSPNKEVRRPLLELPRNLSFGSFG
jgi:hypothetical protein